jgi:thiosulfate reductase cytochrome b subunit
MLSFQVMFWKLQSNRLPKPLNTAINSAVALTKPDFPFPEPWKTVWYTIVLLIILSFVIVGGLLIFSKKPSIEALLMIIIGVALAVLVVRVFVGLTWKKTKF